METSPELAEIERKRQELRISRAKLERLAHLGANYYWQLQAGYHKPSPAILARLKLALQRYQATPKADYSAQSIQINMIVRLAVALICQVRGLDAERIQQSDPGRRATQSPEWQLAASIRHDAWALVNGAFGIAGADLARAAGVSKAAISQAISAVVDKRDDPDFDREMDRLERALTGGGW
ncbi:hypothetical protein M1D80_11910 [Phyllobacteriaceae bacterium JZ32]